MAGAMRLGVFDNHMMVGELLAARQVKAVENAFQPLAREFGADVVRDNFAPSAKEWTLTLLAGQAGAIVAR